jgi:hypothetical protein
VADPRQQPLRLPIRFDDRAWAEDMAATTHVGQVVAERTRREFERRGVLASDLKPCAAHGQDGTCLEHCFKVYLPTSSNPMTAKFGMVFELRKDASTTKAVLVFLAFGMRHHPRHSHALTVYQRAHARLHG